MGASQNKESIEKNIKTNIRETKQTNVFVKNSSCRVVFLIFHKEIIKNSVALVVFTRLCPTLGVLRNGHMEKQYIFAFVCICCAFYFLNYVFFIFLIAVSLAGRPTHKYLDKKSGFPWLS